MATKVEEAIVEAEQELVTFAPQHEGFRDFARLNLREAANAFVQQRIAVYDRRVELLRAFTVAAEALVADGHPGLPVAAMDAAAFADLQDQVRTITAAFSRTSGDALADLGLTSDEPRPK